MRKSRSTLLLGAVALGLAAAASANIAKEPPVYFDAGQYSAALLQSAHLWRLQPLSGDDVDVIDRGCTNSTQIPHGVWLVTRDAEGRAQLVAPSTTVLPPGFPEQIALRSCGAGAADARALAVPAVVLDWIQANVNSVLIDE